MKKILFSKFYEVITNRKFFKIIMNLKEMISHEKIRQSNKIFTFEIQFGES